MASDWINSEKLMLDLKDKLNIEMQAAAEPVIRKAVEEAEKEMRKRLAEMFIAIIDSNFSVERMGTDLRILVMRGRDINTGR